jgi:hypothetical protein
MVPRMWLSNFGRASTSGALVAALANMWESCIPSFSRILGSCRSEAYNIYCRYFVKL